MEDEQELLSSSLFALTSHFAQVQFRLRQIVDSPAEQRDQLLQSLEEFAFRGIPDEVTNSVVAGQKHTDADGGRDTIGTKSDVGSHEPLFEAMELQRTRQIELIEQLKRQLTDVEKFAYESGSKILPQSMMVEKQRVIIDEFREKLNLNVRDDELPQLSSEQLRNQVDNALVELVGPVKMKDTLVGQLKTQIVDLERFVAYLQCETYDLKQMTKAMSGFKGCDAAYSTYNSKTAKSRRQSRMGSTTSSNGMDVGADGGEPVTVNQNGASAKQTIHTTNDENKHSSPESVHPANPKSNHRQTGDGETLTDKAAGVLEKASSILNMFAVTQLGCGAPNRFQKNTLKRTNKGNHWGDLRAQLEIDVQEIISLVSSAVQVQQQQQQRCSNASSSSASSKRAKTTTTSSDDDDDDDDTFYDASKAGQSMSTTTTVTARASNDTLASLQLEITVTVRKHFAITLQRLIEHGLGETVASSTSLVPFIGCFARRPAAAMSATADDYDDGGQRRQMHAWELFLEYYHIKNGDEFNETPARMLSQSFNLDITDGASSVTSNKQSLLSAIGNIINMHSPYKRSANSHFKALISMGLK